MELNEALIELINSDLFKQRAKNKDKEGGRLRMFVSRYKKGEISKGTAVDLLDQFGYDVDIQSPSLKFQNQKDGR